MLEYHLSSRHKTDESRQFDSPTYLKSCKENYDQAEDLDWTNDFVIFKMDDLDTVLDMSFIFKHKVILMPLVKCLVVMGSKQTIIQTNSHQPKGVKMMTTL